MDTCFDSFKWFNYQAQIFFINILTSSHATLMIYHLEKVKNIKTKKLEELKKQALVKILEKLETDDGQEDTDEGDDEVDEVLIVVKKSFKNRITIFF